jgi:nitrogenase molybdenum-iron protein beta chain
MEAARELESRFGIPWVSISSLPVGAEESARLLETLAETIPLNVDSVNTVKGELRQREGYHLNNLADAYYIQGWQREFALIAGSSVAPGIAAFLATTLGLLPSLVVITDNPADQARHDVAETLNGLLPGFSTQLLFSEDRAEIREAVLQRPPGIILGSSLEAEAAQRLNIPLVEVSFPVTGQVLLDKRHAGIRGALTLLEDVGRAILANTKELNQ